MIVRKHLSILVGITMNIYILKTTFEDEQKILFINIANVDFEDTQYV